MVTALPMRSRIKHLHIKFLPTLAEAVLLIRLVSWSDHFISGGTAHP